jgi:hypothetical protein
LDSQRRTRRRNFSFIYAASSPVVELPVQHDDLHGVASSNTCPQVHVRAAENGNAWLPGYDCPAEGSNNVNTWSPVYGFWESRNVGFCSPRQVEMMAVDAR